MDGIEQADAESFAPKASGAIVGLVPVQVSTDFLIIEFFKLDFGGYDINRAISALTV